MKWESELVFKGNRQVWKMGAKDRMLAGLFISIGIIIGIGLYLLSIFRWTT